MRDILDPANFWVGTTPGALVFGNKLPVASPDTVTVAKNSGPVTVQVLANDFDPEGGDLTLLSASAGLGTSIAESDGTVTYTPPAGISGFDTIVYEIADPLDQRRTGQVDVTILDAGVAVTATAENTLTVTADGLLDLTITNPVEFAGTYAINTNDFLGGPVPLVAPTLSGTPTQGNVLSAAEGLWAYDTDAGTPVRSWQWRRGANDIVGETAATYTVSTMDSGQDISVLETLSDQYGQRSAASGSVSIASAGFSPEQDAALISWWDATDAATITDTAGTVDTWTDKAGGTVLQAPDGFQRPVTGSRNLGGLNLIDFSGNGVLEAVQALPASGDIAFHMVLVIDEVDSPFAAILALDAANDMQIDANAGAQFDGRLNAAGIGDSTNLTGGPFQGSIVLSAVFDATGTATAEVFVGNISRGSAAYSSPLDPSVALMLMTNRSRNSWVDGAVAELIVTGDISARADHHDYLVSKWGVT